MAGKDAFTELVAKIRELYVRELGGMSVEERQERTKQVNWETGRYIVETEQDGEVRAKYGRKLISNLSAVLEKELGSGFSKRNLAYSRAFYNEYEIVHTCAQLNWSHYRALLSLPDKGLRNLMEQRAINEKLTNSELAALVKAQNKELALLRQPNRKLTPRKAQFNLCKVVQRIHEGKTVLSLDLGFYVTEPLSPQRARNFRDEDHVAWRTTETGYQLEKVQCKIGERYCYIGFLQKVVDGDTLLVDVQLANGRAMLQRLRLRGVLAKELGSEMGERCRTYVRRLMKIGTRLKILTYGKDRYGRYVADVFMGDTFVNERIIEKGLG